MDFPSHPDLLKQLDVNCSNEGVAGNGALTRLAPVPLFFYRNPEEAVEYSGISGQITHGDKKAYDACRYYGALIVAALHNEKKNELLSDTFYKHHQAWFGDTPLHPDIMIIAQGSYKRKGGYRDGIRGKGYIVNALEAALWVFWSDDGSFENGALSAVNLGDDTTATTAIYGQLAGTYYGYEKLPKKWCDMIYAKEFLACVSNWIVHEGERFIRQT
jgi:ADP-ribosylglycohydrolase